MNGRGGARKLIAVDTPALERAEAEDALREPATDARAKAEACSPKPEPVTPEALADALEQNAGALRQALDRLKAVAAQELAKREDALKLQSNVSLAHVALKGDPKSTQRRVDLGVKVDGQEGAARATLPASPFRFIVIDDPVQSMDPARVDGLARVLHAAAKDRQVLVFTHDDRLHESLRRLAIPATVLEVTRAESSQVSTRPALTPVSRYIADAMALAQDKDLSPDVARRVIPGLCRQALEAACMEAVRRRRIGRGESHQAVEELLMEAQTLTNLAALALFDDLSRAGGVMAHLNRVGGSSTGDTFKACNAGAHGQFAGDPVPFVRDVEKLSRWLVAQ